ncbi:hypothetical protein [Synechococcus sp. BA-132 BA5]|uniref:hypothetical protein n=1 Tax=Synechococcus sp. BA-132 BA5 TaxID=3110252 RepID=UPI002B215BDE|nr:hypothetical protein [Synechococcus sp. BA-132 BA5]MEA5415085.1 hypothetical protein [Synechococcus sp. BA-132 BA5]
MKALGCTIGVTAQDLDSLVGGHLAAQGGEATGRCVAGAGEFNQQIGAEGRETAALLRG